MAVSVRPMEARDLSEVARLSELLGYPVTQDTLRDCLREVQATPGHYLGVAESGEALAGWIFVRRELTMNGSARADVGSLVVDERLRGQGVGKRLMQEAEAWALKNGYTRMWLSSQSKRTEAHEFYKRLGYEVKKTSYFFEKKLSESS